jgi:hypothetical protein
MPEDVLTSAELERLLAEIEAFAPSPANWWHGKLLRVCRHALALEAEVDRLQQLRLGAANEAQDRLSETVRLRAEIACLRRQVEAQRHEVHEDDGDA